MPSQSSGICFSDNMARFSHILQPIRDLTKNWDIDVATQLEEYLNEIEKIRISFDNGRTTMNFAEAALLIQGSACVYSKKVEYLYTLVYQTLDLISSKKRLQQASSVDNQGQDKDATFKDQEEEFLPLDDIVEAKNIDLEEDENITNEFSQVIPRTPMALIKLSEKDKGDMLLSRTGEVLGSRLDFKMNTCTVHSSGALLLDLSHLSLLDNSFKRLTSTTPQVNGVLSTQPVLTTNDNCGPHNLENDDIQQACAAPDDVMNDSGDDVEPIMPNDDYGMFQGNDFQQTSATHNIESEQGSEECRVALRPRTEPQPPLNVQHQQFRDPWKVLDPHEQSLKANLKPLKTGRPFRIPAGLKPAIESKGRKKRKRSNNENNIDKIKTPTISLAEFISQALYSHASKCPKNPLHAPKFQEFEYLYWVEFRKRQAFLKREKKRLVQLLTPEQFKDINLVPGDREEDDEEHEIADSPADVENGDGDYFERYNDDFPDAEEENVAPVEPVGLEDQGDELVVSSYESLVRKHVQGFLSNAAQYAQETDLSRRVRDWEEKVKPKLQEEDTHRPFDIHKYGEDVLASFNDSPQKTFKEIVKEKEPFEICRHFLATLQLANNYNVEITSEGDDLNVIDTMALKLLHRTPAHKAIASYRAPSVLT